MFIADIKITRLGGFVIQSRLIYTIIISIKLMLADYKSLSYHGDGLQIRPDGAFRSLFLAYRRSRKNVKEEKAINFQDAGKIRIFYFLNRL